MAKPGHDIVSILDLLSGVNLRIPKYQRGYAWDETNFEELWEDIVERALKGEGLFMGSMIIARDDTRDGHESEIVDGQQRLITFSILLRVMYDLLVNEKDQERFRRDIYRHIATDEGEYKLTLGTIDEDFFDRFIKRKNRESDRRGIKRSHKMIRIAYDLFKEKIEKEINSGKYSSNVDFLDKLFEAIKQNTQLLEITVGDEFDAYAIFESINAKRVDLTPAELIKNYVFSAVSRSEEELNKVQSDWEDAVDKLSPSDKEISITNFIRHYWIATTEDVREKDLYRKIKNQYSKAPSKIPGFVDDLARHSGSYAAIVFPEIITTTDRGLNIEKVSKINRFNFKQTYPLLLAALMKEIDQDNFDALTTVLEATIIRRSVIGLNPNELEEALSTGARKMHKDGIASLDAIKDKLRNLTPPDKSVMQELINGSYSPNTKIILEEYEISKGTGEKEIKNPTIEHIMPQTPKDYSDWHVTLEEHEHWLNNIGNLTLLGSPLNSSASNGNFDAKKVVYSNSEFLITREVLSEDVWNSEKIKSRANNISEFLVKKWPLF